MTALLSFATGEPFASGAAGYSSNPGIGTWSRIMISIRIEGTRTLETTAMVDTAAPYMVCRRDVADSVGLKYSEFGETDEINIRGVTVEGSLHRVPLSFLAEQGDDLTIEASVFVPRYIELPHSFIGLTSCLESVFFAVDPFQEMFYFGAGY